MKPRLLRLPEKFDKALVEYCRRMEKEPNQVLKSLIARGVYHSDITVLKEHSLELYTKSRRGRPKVSFFNPDFIDLGLKVKQLRQANLTVRSIGEELSLTPARVRWILKRIKDNC